MMPPGSAPPPGLRCPQCHSTILPGQQVCNLCGHNTNDYIVVQVDPPTWQERLYLVFAVLLVLQGLFMCALGIGWVDGHVTAPVTYIGLGVAIVGVGLVRAQLWAQWVTRVAGILVILGTASNALRMGLSIGTWPHAKEQFLISLGLCLYWIALEYLVFVVGE